MDTPSSSNIKVLKPIILTIAALLALAIVFRIGMFVGYRKAMYSYDWGDNYHRMFGGPKRGFFGEFEGRGFMDAHGIFGTVLKIDGNTMVIQDKDETEKDVLVGTSTSIRKGNDAVALTNVSSTDRVVIIGAPNPQGQIDAKLIRVIGN